MPGTSVGPTTDTRLLATLGRLGVKPDIAQKSTSYLRFILDNSAAAADAAKAFKDIKSGGVSSLGIVSLGAATTASGSASSEMASAKYTALGLNLTTWSLNLGKVATMTPGRAGAYATVAFSQKILVLAGIASESDANECRIALGKLAADVAATSLTWETGIGAYLGAAGAILDGSIAYGACSKPK